MMHMIFSGVREYLYFSLTKESEPVFVYCFLLLLSAAIGCAEYKKNHGAVED